MMVVRPDEAAARRADVRARGLALAGLAVAAWPSAAAAQIETTLIQPAIPQDYDRGRNVSVLERPRPDYDPLGIRSGSVVIRPSIELGGGATDNAFLSSTDRRSDVFALVAPTVRAESDWNRHALLGAAGGRFRRYASDSRRNQDEWFLSGLGRLELGRSYSVTAEAQAARTQEEPFTGETTTDLAALSAYKRSFLSVRGQYRDGRVRALLSADHQFFNFSSLQPPTGPRLSQANRDRTIGRLAGQVEYALSPSTAVYGQLVRSDIDYSSLLAPGVANRDSEGYRAIAGLSLDISGFFRGVVGVGYTRRDYRSPLYKDASGLSAEARIEYFPTELTTVTINLRRVLEDSNIGIASAFFDNRAGLRVDHELLRNLLLNTGLERARQTYVGSPARDDIWRVRAGARYLSSRTLTLDGLISYGNRQRRGEVSDFRVRELAGLISVTFRR